MLLQFKQLRLVDSDICIDGIFFSHKSINIVQVLGIGGIMRVLFFFSLIILFGFLSMRVQVFGRVLFNQTFVGIPFAVFGYWMMKRNPIPPIHVLPTFSRVLTGKSGNFPAFSQLQFLISETELAVFIVVEEIAFYYSHR